MYDETFNQFLQTFAGCVRSIIELKNKDEEMYTDDSFGIVLICDGIEKVNEEFLEKLIEAKVFDPELFYNNYYHTDVNDNQKMRPINVKSTIGEHKKDASRDRYDYASQNISHIFSNKLTAESVTNMLDSQENGEYIVNLHRDNVSPSEWVTRPNKKDKKKKEEEVYQMPEVNFFFCGKHKNVGKIESHMWFFKGFCTYLNPKY